MTVLACDDWPTNGHLIEHVASLYLRDTDFTVDLTYGRGVWWKRWRPRCVALVTNDIDPEKDTDDHFDFRSTGYADGAFDVVAFDPPYVSIGGRKGSAMADLHDRFGLIGASSSPAGVQEDINAGLTEAARIVRRGGLILVKCQSYVSSGRLWPGAFLTWEHAVRVLGLELVDEFVHRAGVRPQPTKNRDGTPRRQVHARRNTSTLYVFRRPK